MNERTLQRLKQIYKEFYFKHNDLVEIPRRIDEREFGYVPFGGSMIRHLSFKSEGELRAFLVKEGPRSVYYSVSYYYEPTLPMSEKGWKGGDLAFDIDCDNLITPCKLEHKVWKCRGCGSLGKGEKPERCERCDSEKLEELSWACDGCLKAAKQEAQKLLDILQQDFGIRGEEVKVYFSGSRGYHVVVESSSFELLDQMARSEIADYITGSSLIPEFLGLSRRTKFDELLRRLPRKDEAGWRGRLARYFLNYPVKGYQGTDEDERAKLLFIFEKFGYKGFKRLIVDAARACGSAIDTMVTTDTHRIFRLAGTLHGETGLMKRRCKDLSSFDPLNDAAVLSDEPIKIFVEYSPEFRLRDQRFGPFKKEEVWLPAMAATYLMARGLAEAL